MVVINAFHAGGVTPPTFAEMLLAAGREASSGVGPLGHARHRPERTVPYRVVQEYYPARKAHLASQGRDVLACVMRSSMSISCLV